MRDKDICRMAMLTDMTTMRQKMTASTGSSVLWWIALNSCRQASD